MTGRVLLTVVAACSLVPAAWGQAAAVAFPVPVTLGGRAGELVRVPLPNDLAGKPLGVWSTEKFGASFRQSPGGGVALELHVPANTPVGLYPLRLVTTAGVSDVRVFTVDDRPDAPEAGDHGKPAAAQAVTSPCVVVGAVETETLDYYRVPVKAGEPLTVEAFARRLGSPLDPVVTLLDAAGKGLPGAFADDTPGLQGDARVTITPAADGFVVAEVRDSTYKGGPEHRYRLRIGRDLTAVDSPPFAVSRHRQSVDSAPALVPFHRLTLRDRPWVAAFATGRGWPRPVRVTDEPQFVEAEPNDTPATAFALPVPSGVSAGFGKASDRDHFRFTLKAGETVAVIARTADVLSPCDVLLKVLDPGGAVVGTSDPQKPLAEVKVTAKAAGDYVAACEHLNYLAGPAERYWLQLLPVRPDFAVTLADPRTVVPAGGVGLLPGVTVERRNGFAGPVTLTVAGPDGLSGTLTVPPGASGPVVVPVTAPAGVASGAARCSIIGTGGGLTRVGDTSEALRAAFPGTQPPPEWNGVVAVGIVSAGLKQVALTTPKEAVAGKSVKVNVTLTRRDGDADDVTLTADAPFTPAKPIPVKPGGPVEVVLPVDPKVKSGPTQLVLRVLGPGGRPVGAAAGWVTVTGGKPDPPAVPKAKKK